MVKTSDYNITGNLNHHHCSKITRLHYHLEPNKVLHSLKLTANAPENRPSQKETIVFQPSIFRCYASLASFQGGYWNSTQQPKTRDLNHWLSKFLCGPCGSQIPRGFVHGIPWRFSMDPMGSHVERYMYRSMNGWFLSGQIIIFHQPRFPWNKGISLTKPPFGVRSCEVAIIWPDTSMWSVMGFHSYTPFLHPSYWCVLISPLATFSERFAFRRPISHRRLGRSFWRCQWGGASENLKDALDNFSHCKANLEFRTSLKNI